jgi:hypothetical protein
MIVRARRRRRRRDWQATGTDHGTQAPTLAWVRATAAAAGGGLTEPDAPQVVTSGAAGGQGLRRDSYRVDSESDSDSHWPLVMVVPRAGVDMTARLGQMVTLSPRRVAEQPLRAPQLRFFPGLL